MHTTGRFSTLGATLLLVSLLATPWAALAEPRLTLEIAAEKEITEQRDGATVTRYEVADEAITGDVIRYTLTYRNQGDSPAVGAALVDPVPEGTAYLAGSAAGADTAIRFSADGGQSYLPEPLQRVVRGPDGQPRQETIPPEEYTHVRWQLEQPVAAGAEGQVHFKVRVR